jgi:HPt (histidine-containing phosphotransfer) domain-containing protein
MGQAHKKCLIIRQTGGSVGQAQAIIRKNAKAKSQELVFDRAHLARYTMDSPDFEREIVGLFVAQLPSILDSLFTAKSSEDWRFATHTLKGSAQAIGAVKIGNFAVKLEKITSFEQVEKRAELLAGLKKATREFDELARLLYP